MPGALSKYAFINANIRARISKLIGDEEFRQMAKMHSVEEVLSALRGSPYAYCEEVYTQTGDIKLCERELLKIEIQIYNDIAKRVRGATQDLICALLTRYEIDNLKNALRLFFDRKLRKRSVEHAVHYILYEKIVSDIPYDAIVNAEQVNEIHSALASTPYRALIKDYLGRIEQEGSLFYLEMALDRYFYDNLFTYIHKLSVQDRDNAIRLVGIEIDLHNITVIIRLKTFQKLSFEQISSHLIPRGFALSNQEIASMYTTSHVVPLVKKIVHTHYPGLTTLFSEPVTDTASHLLLIERLLQQIMHHEVQRILSGNPFTIGILLAYFVLKRNENRKLQTILNAKYYKMPREQIEGIV